MCGIVGFVGPNAGDAHRIKRMADVLTHRGPDEDGFFVEPGVELGMRRLSIIDVSHGHQPIAVADGAVQVVFNGEIYNFRRLRHQLEQHGHRFTTDSDSEVIAAGYLEYGSNVAHHLEGMFAIAIWDGRVQELHLMRDRLGKKPLLYAEASDGGFIFASEARAILRSGWAARADLNSINNVLAVGYTPIEYSAYEGIKNVPPAHVLRWRNGAISHHRYWQPEFEPKPGWGFAEAKERVFLEIDRAVSDRMVSERPIGAFLSGGYDSTLVTALMAKHYSGRVKTFTISFDEEQYDESPHAQQVADYLGTDHKSLRVTPDPELLAQVIPSVFDQPFADSSAIPSFLLNQFARTELVVALGGDGGDEAFGGYERYRAAPILQQFNAVTHVLGPLSRRISTYANSRSWRRVSRLARALTPYGNLMNRYIGLMTLTDRENRDALWLPDISKRIEARDPEKALAAAWRGSDAQNAYDQMIATDISTYLPGDLLVKADTTSMANSLELRSPLLDHRVVELGVSLPASMRVSSKGTKLILKDIARDLVPAHLLDRPKMGFGIPRAAWLRGPLRELVRDTLSPESMAQRGWFSGSAVQRILIAHDQGEDRDNIIWPLLMVELWARNWLDNAKA